MAKFVSPEPFKVDQQTSCPEWQERFQRFQLTTKPHKEDGDVKVSGLVYAMGGKLKGYLNCDTSLTRWRSLLL